MPAGAALGGASLIGAGLSASAAKKAASTQAQAADKSAQIQLDMFNQMRGDLSPYRNFGSTALPGLARLLGIDGGGGFTTSGLSGQGGAGSAAAGPDWNAYLQANPDVMAWAQGGGGDPTNPNASLAERAAYHYQNSGQAEGRVMPQFTGGGYASTLGAGGDLDWDQYLQQYPDVLREYNSLTPEQRAGAGVATPQEFARRHYQLYGQNANEGRQTTTINPIQRQLESLPGYQFARDQGIKSVNNALVTPDSYHTLYGNDATAFNNIDAADKFDLRLIDRAKTKADSQGGGATDVPVLQPCKAADPRADSFRTLTQNGSASFPF